MAIHLNQDSALNQALLPRMEYIYISRDENTDHLKQTNVEEHQDRFEWVEDTVKMYF